MDPIEEFLFANDYKKDQLKRIVGAQILTLATEKKKARRVGSVSGRVSIHRDRAGGFHRLFNDYFAEEPVYGEKMFRRRFRMKRELFLKIVQDVERHSAYFVQKRNAAYKLGFSPLQKVTAAIRMLAYGSAADSFDEYLRMAESTALETLKEFCKAIVEVYGEEYLRSPNEADLARLLKEGEERGFPGMIGSIDCMHWTWKNCPTAWHGQFCGKEKTPTIVLEAVASKNLWIWHAFFGLPGSLNDINVLDRSPVFLQLLKGENPPVSYSVNGNDYDMGYYLADGIYPPYATLVSSFSNPGTRKLKVAKKCIIYF